MYSAKPSNAVQAALAARQQRTVVPDGIRDQIQDRIKVALIESGLSEEGLQSLQFHWGEKVRDGVYVVLEGQRQGQFREPGMASTEDINITDHYFGATLESPIPRNFPATFRAARGGGYSTLQGKAHITLRADTIADLAGAFGVELGQDMARTR